MELQEYRRKPFAVKAVQITLGNIYEVAEWCKGTIEMVSTKMLGVETDLPVIKLKGNGEFRNKEFTASLGCFIAELNGSFRVYKPNQMDENYELVEEGSNEEEESDPNQLQLPHPEDMRAAI